MKRIFTVCFVLVSMGISVVNAQNAQNTFSYKVGDYEVILLSEGQNPGNPGILIDATQEMLNKAMPDGTFTTAINAFLVKTPEKNVLFDTGVGKNLLNNLSSVGVKPDQIQTLILTHMHGDHIGGMMKDGKVVFGNADVYVSEAEKNYWADKDAMNVLRAYGQKVHTVQPGELGAKSGDGMFYIKAYGHTPGHMACLLQSKGEKLLIWADLAHVMPVQMLYPQISVTYDVDPVMAAQTRQAILKYAADNKIPVAGMHIAYPGIGRIESSAAGGYVFTPAK